MHLLILGGTQFLGRHLVDAALAVGHDVTLFNRGQTNPELYPDVEKLRGDRDGNLTELSGRKFDAVIDVAGYLPRVVKQSAGLLEPNVGRYVFISSISVFADFTKPGLNEDSTLATMEDETSEDIDEYYGALKVLCEKEVTSVFGDRAFVVRPGLIVGPHDPTNRFTYWVTRVADGGDVLAPGPPERPVQYIDARDLAEWAVRGTEAGMSGAYNVTGPQPPVAISDVLDACRTAAGSDANFVWVDDDFLTAAEVGPWMELPLWVPSDDDFAALMQVDVSRAVAAGLTFRTPVDTARATLEWARSEETLPGDAGLDREKERKLLESATSAPT
jgi:2'-hydroxyisoflavone reductase